MAYADDLILVASTESGLQELLSIRSKFLRPCGLKANANKYLTVSIVNMPKEKKTFVDSEIKFKIGKNTIPSLKRSDEWKYLGVPFTPEGKSITKVEGNLIEKLNKLTKAPLKPQQRLWAARTIVIPSIMYQLTMGGISFGYLRSIDRTTRKYVRKWLNLPYDCPNAYIHANIKDDGLGIPSLRWKAPAEGWFRLAKLAKSTCITCLPNSRFQTQKYKFS